MKQSIINNIRMKVDERIASRPRKIHRPIPKECLDEKGNLKPDSPCAKKMRENK